MGRHITVRGSGESIRGIRANRGAALGPVNKAIPCVGRRRDGDLTAAVIGAAAADTAAGGRISGNTDLHREGGEGLDAYV